jgi:hypothetical protein
MTETLRQNISTSMLKVNSPSSRAISFQLHHVCLSTAAIMASSWAGVRTLRERPVLITSAGVTLPVSRRLVSFVETH